MLFLNVVVLILNFLFFFVKFEKICVVVLGCFEEKVIKFGLINELERYLKFVFLIVCLVRVL